MLEGLVINTQKTKFNVKTSLGVFLCDVKGSLLERNQDNKNFIITGDLVLFTKTEEDRGIIHEVKQRKTEFYRYESSPQKSELYKELPFDIQKRQMIASNIDQAVIVFSIKNPKYKTNLIDRYIILLKKQNITPIICFNKIDLSNYDEVKEDVENYQNKGIKVIVTSTYTENGLDELREILKYKLSAFSGSSGVGKSSLINKILGEEKAKTSDISSFLDKGKHTTTTSYIYEIGSGGMLIDTPGMKGFDFYRVKEDIEDSFKDIVNLAKDCKFRNCKHQDEPNCAVKDALEEGLVSSKNYHSYMKLKSNKIVERKKHENVAKLKRESNKNIPKKEWENFSLSLNE